MGVDTPDTPGVHSLKEYWAHGPGAVRIGWSSPGAFQRCIDTIQGEVTQDGKPPLPEHVIKGLCARLAHEATGQWPGAHHDGKH